MFKNYIRFTFFLLIMFSVLNSSVPSDTKKSVISLVSKTDNEFFFDIEINNIKLSELEKSSLSQVKAPDILYKDTGELQHGYFEFYFDNDLRIINSVWPIDAEFEEFSNIMLDNSGINQWIPSQHDLIRAEFIETEDKKSKLKITVSPVQYNSALKKIRIYRNFFLKILFEE
ncbi:MAG: hypothetical protein WC337_06910 [Candidatus Muiribacteriota bacterium]